MDPVLEIQGAIIARLKADAGVSSLVAQRVYDIPPATAAKPYISIGPSNYATEDADCIYGGEVMIQVDAWSEATVLSEVRRIADAVRKAIRSADLSLTTNALVTFDHWRTDYVIDGALKQASVRFTGIVEES